MVCLFWRVKTVVCPLDLNFVPNLSFRLTRIYLLSSSWIRAWIIDDVCSKNKNKTIWTSSTPLKLFHAYALVVFFLDRVEREIKCCCLLLGVLIVIVNRINETYDMRQSQIGFRGVHQSRMQGCLRLSLSWTGWQLQGRTLSMSLGIVRISQSQKLQDSGQGSRFSNIKIDYSQQYSQEDHWICRQLPSKLPFAICHQRHLRSSWAIRAKTERNHLVLPRVENQRREGSVPAVSRKRSWGTASGDRQLRSIDSAGEEKIWGEGR